MSLYEKKWFHGTNEKFEAWSFPPPRKKGNEILQVPHTAVFLTSEKDFAQGAGKHLCSVKFIKPPKIIDTVNNYESSERLRLLVMKNPAIARSLNINKTFWHEGWKTGEVMRFTYQDKFLASELDRCMRSQAKQMKTSLEDFLRIFKHNLTRGLIEEMVKATRTLGFDGFVGYEIDKHSADGQRKSREIIALLNPGFITRPEWLA
ncbi:hypothetical protein CWM53_04980 [Klebsiella sp. A-Nf5]|uniref:hypothetical protein n=1 Tax=unclassified Klebsiella TaxID=2608929 RepID=UPI000C2AC332|nr:MULTISPECIES: hypothetical protein [unclassified Klebsiella]PJX33360.1 hypothetical protein CWM53_04980 [Klebsiella sp. A-Nf5]PJX35885.1 hypothetical protein CWM59_20860 [Klebsiella sp. B-Nf7]PJX46388.1 hypothetical protein CWM60_21070 [Klebsiella sp. C1-16S-Nf17]